MFYCREHDYTANYFALKLNRCPECELRSKITHLEEEINTMKSKLSPSNKIICSVCASEQKCLDCTFRYKQKEKI